MSPNLVCAVSSTQSVAASPNVWWQVSWVGFIPRAKQCVRRKLSGKSVGGERVYPLLGACNLVTSPALGLPGSERWGFTSGE